MSIMEMACTLGRMDLNISDNFKRTSTISSCYCYYYYYYYYRLTGRGKFIDDNGKEWSGMFDGKNASQLKLKIQ